MEQHADGKDLPEHRLAYKRLIALNQDAAYRQPFRVDFWVHPIWVRFLENGDVAIAFFNLNDGPAYLDLALADIGLGGRSGKALKTVDLLTGKTVGTFKDHLPFGTVEPHTCRVFRGKVVNA